MLAPQKVTKEEGTQPSRPTAPLRCWLRPLCLTSLRELAYAVTDCCTVLVINKIGGHETRPSSLHTTQATAELEQPMADYPHFVSATQRDGMGLFSPNSKFRSLDGSKTRFFFILS